MADTMDWKAISQQEKACKKDLLDRKIPPDEYFCCILSLYGQDKTFVSFPSLIGEISLTNPTLHSQLVEYYETFFAQCQNQFENCGSKVSKSKKENGVVYTGPQCELDADLDLELAIQLSLKESGAGGSDIYEPEEADLLDYAGWAAPATTTTEPNGFPALHKEKSVSQPVPPKFVSPPQQPIVFNGGRPTNSVLPRKQQQKRRNKCLKQWEIQQDGLGFSKAKLSMPNSGDFVFEKSVKKEPDQDLKSAKKHAPADVAEKSILDMLRFPDARARMPDYSTSNNTHIGYKNHLNTTHVQSNTSPSIDQEPLGSGNSKKNRKKKKTKNNPDVDRPISFKPVIYWIRRDLRIYDNPALVEASTSNSPVIPVFIWSEKEEGPEGAGGSTKLWIHHALKSLNTSYHTRFQTQILFFKTSSCLQELRNLVNQTGARTIVWNDVYEPVLKKRDDQICGSLQKSGVEVKRFHSYLLYEPSSVNMESIGMRGIGSVTHFMEACRQSSVAAIRQPVDAPSGLPHPGTWPASVTLQQLELAKMPIRRNGQVIDWAAPMVASWDFSEDAAYEALQLFLAEGIRNYDKESGRSDMVNTCKISPYIHFGQISPHTILAEAKHRKCPKFLRKLAWRDLSYFLLHMFPTMDSVPMRPPYRLQRWSKNKDHIKAWQRGRTGYPLVDAAMRELWLTGWMNNYMRHVVASFLISYLHLHWIVGYKWFQDTLFDADVAINAMMWQNGGMSGLDHWNFVMHPVDAAMTCDPKGDYIRRWVPELAALPSEFVTQPWKCPPSILRRSGVELGKTYPHRVITKLDEAREQSLRDAVDVRTKHGAGWMDRHGNDMVPLPNGMKIPVITRKEFKYKTANPDAQDNPHTAVLRGYRSRGRDEMIAFENQVDFLASTMNECVLRNERKSKSAHYEVIY